MNLFLFSFLFIEILLNIAGTQAIINGKVFSINNGPWTSLITGTREGADARHRFAGVIVGPRLILTLATDCAKTSDILVYVGDTFTEKGDIFAVNQTIVHSKYAEGNYGYNICLLVTDKVIPFGARVQPAALTQMGHPFGTNEKYLVLGFGRLRAQEGVQALPHRLSHQYLKYNSNCKEEYKDIFSNNLFCVGGQEGALDKATDGDNGGPVMATYNGEVVGLIMNKESDMTVEKDGQIRSTLCIYIGPVRDWIDNQRQNVNQGFI